jgi:5-methylthioadenosine/S-adenosylhomocysteine deaminase
MDAKPVDLLIKDGLVVTMNSQREIFPVADLAITGGRITAIAPNLKLQAKSVIHAQDHAVLPGLINAHMHETLTRGACEDLPLNRWLVEVCFPLDRSYTYEIMRAAAMMCQAEMIRGGTTTFLDIYRFPSACAEVAEKSGLRAVITPQILVDPPDVGESVESAEAFVSSWNGRNTRISPGFGPHAPYSCPLGTYQIVAELAEKYDVPIHTHLAETQWEVGVIGERYGCSPTEFLERCGVLSPRLSVAHGVHLTEAELNLLIKHDVPVVYNPTSNMKLASGVAPVVKMLSMGHCVGLGTDSNLSNNNLDMWEEMRAGSLLQKLYQNDATALPCETIFEMATVRNAQALGMKDAIGSLEPGKYADIILVDLNQPHLWPLFQGQQMRLIEHLVYSANAADVTHTIVAGNVLMADRKLLTLDSEEVRGIVGDSTHKLFKIAGLFQDKTT